MGQQRPRKRRRIVVSIQGRVLRYGGGKKRASTVKSDELHHGARKKEKTALLNDSVVVAKGGIGSGNEFVTEWRTDSRSRARLSNPEIVGRAIDTSLRLGLFRNRLEKKN